MPCQSPSESGLKQSEKEYVSNGKRSKVGGGVGFMEGMCHWKEEQRELKKRLSP